MRVRKRTKFKAFIVFVILAVTFVAGFVYVRKNLIEYTDKYISNWKRYFENKDFNGMEKEFNKLKEQLKELIPIENTINEARKIEVLHNLIKNNGQNFNLTKEQLELVEKLK